jgi:hypothetical protein
LAAFTQVAFVALVAPVSAPVILAVPLLVTVMLLAMVVVPFNVIDANELIVVAAFTATVPENVALDEDAKIVAPDIVVLPAIVPNVPVSVPGPLNVTVPDPPLLNVPLLVIPPPKMNGELFVVENEPVEETVNSPLNVLAPVVELSVKLPLIVVAPLTVMLLLLRFSEPVVALMVRELKALVGLAFNIMA